MHSHFEREWKACVWLWTMGCVSLLALIICWNASECPKVQSKKAFDLIVNKLVSGLRVPGFDSLLQLLTLACCQCRPNEAAGGGSNTWIPVTMWETEYSLLLPFTQPSPGHCESSVYPSVSISLHLSASHNKTKIHRKKNTMEWKDKLALMGKHRNYT